MSKTAGILALLLALLTVLSAFAMTGCADTKTPNGEETSTGEATATQDDSTEKAPTLTTFEGVDWINAEKFGFVADGVTPNDRVMREYIKYYGDIPIYFGKEVGLLTVEEYSSMVIQTYTGTTSTLQRFFDGTKWGEWRSLSN